VTPLLFTLGLVAVLTPFAVWAIRHVRRQRGAGVLVSSILLIFGVGMPVVPPPPPVAEQVIRAREDDEDDEDKEGARPIP
jgi:hypothetical protein